MAIALTPEEGETLALFAADYQAKQFRPGRTLTVTATFSDGTSATARTTVPTPPTPRLTLAYEGMQRDRVGGGNTLLRTDGAMDGTLTLTVNGSAGRTLTRLRLDSNAPGTWDTVGGTSWWVLGVARGLDEPLLNQAGSMAIALTPEEGETLTLFASNYQNKVFQPGRTLTVTATFSDGTAATARITVPQ
jgi:hypothetical protein